MNVTKNSRIVKVLSQAYTKPQKELNELLAKDSDFKQVYKDSLKYIKELASDPNPMNLYQLNQIVTYVIDNLIEFNTNFLNLIGDVRRTGSIEERPRFKYRTQEVTAFWQAINGTPEASRIGFAYDQLKPDSLSAMPVAEWIEIAEGRYDFGDLINDVYNQFEIKIAQKVQNTLTAAIKSLPTPNYGAANGINQALFDELLVSMQRLGSCAIVGDHEALIKLPELTAIGGRVSENVIDEVNRSGVIGMYKGAVVVKLVNPYVGLKGFDTALNKGFIYIVPNVRPEMKTLKIWFPGGVRNMQQQNIEDRSYKMLFEQFMAAGVVGLNAVRQPIAVYEDLDLSA